MYKKFDVRKYNSKNKRYFQDGGSIQESKIEEVKIPFTYEDKVRKFYRDKINSQAYKEKLYNLGYSDTKNFLGIPRLFGYNWDKVEDLAKLRSDRVRNTDVERIPKNPFIVDERGDIVYNPNRDKTPNRSHNKWDYDTKRNTIYMDDRYDDSIAMPHEYSHSEVNRFTPDNRMSDKEKKIIEKSLHSSIRRDYYKNPDDAEAWHKFSPYERKADIDAIRFNLYEKGLYNPKTDEYNIKGKWMQNPPTKKMRKLIDSVEWKYLERPLNLHKKPYQGDDRINGVNRYDSILNLMKQISMKGKPYNKNNHYV